MVWDPGEGLKAAGDLGDLVASGAPFCSSS